MFKKVEGGVEQGQLDLSYETLWKSIIRPPRDEYDLEQLGDNKFFHKGKTYIRHDYELINKRGQLIQCSFLEEDIETRESYLMPVVIYLHGNSSSRIEGFRNAPDLLKNGINVVIFDFAGCGLSEGEYISLGWFEKDDVKLIIDFVEKLPGVYTIGLWGRSMGAATTMFYAHSDSRIKAICMDSPFSDFKLLAKELCLKHDIEFNDNEALDTLFKKYVNYIDEYIESQMTKTILKSNISLFSQFNNIRNNYTWAHDNDVLNDIESKLIFKNIVNVKIFVEEIENKYFY